MSYNPNEPYPENPTPGRSPYGPTVNQDNPAAPPLYGYPQPGAGAPNYYAAPPAYDGFAIVAFVTGLLGLAIIPVIFGHLALSRIKRDNTRGGWMAIVGLILGYVAILGYAIGIGLLVAIVAAAAASSA